MKRLMMTVTLVWAVFNTWAGDVSLSEAQAKAQKFISQKYRKCSLTLVEGRDLLEKGAGDGEKDCFYVFNVGDDEGFVIVSADDRTQSILGYAEQGSYDTEQLPDNVKAWLEGYKMEIRYIRENNVQPTANTRGTRATKKNIDPLIKTKWSQSYPYNDGYPKVNNSTCITGCVATALAQVMNYHRYPTGKTTQIPGYTTTTYRIVMPTLPPVTFDWNNMADSYLGYTTAAQKKAVSTLMKYCSMAVEADLGPNSTGAYSSKQMYSLINYFGYSNDIRYVSRSSYDSYSWENLMYTELQGNRPILYRDQGSGGHAFILDGYKEGEGFHFNWGWNGSYDGYFQLSALIPLTGYNFSNLQYATIGISPKGGVSGKEFEVSGLLYRIDDNYNVSVISVKNRNTSNVEIPNSVYYNGVNFTVTSIGNSAFEGCVNITSVSIPSSVSIIGAGAFYGCSGLKSVDIPSGVTTIGEGAFSKCSGLTSVVIPSSVTSIGMFAFYYCTHLTQIISKIQNPFDINNNAFTTYSTTKLVVPKGTKSAYQAKSGWKNFTNINDGTYDNPKKLNIHVAIAGTLPYLISEDQKYLVEELTLTGELNGTDIKYIREMAGISSSFKMRRGAIYTDTSGKLKSLNLSRANIIKGGDCYVYTDVTYTCSDDECVDEWYTVDNSISEYLFYGTKLESIVLPMSVSKVYPSAFRGCSELTSIVVDTDNDWYDSRNHCNAVIESGSNTLIAGCKKTIIPGSVTSIGSSSFLGCSGLTSITIPNSVTSIGLSAFANCSGLSTITSEISNPFVISDYVFSNYATATLTVPAGKKSAYLSTSGWSMFQNIVEAGAVSYDFEVGGICYKIGANSTVSIVSKKEECSGDIIIPNQVKYNGTNYTVTTIGNSAFEGCVDMTSVAIPSSVITIGDAAFYYCTGLKTVDIPNGVKTIGEGAFSKCSDLTSVTIPGSVTSIGKNAFFQCYNLTQITSEIENLFTINDGVFPTSVYSNATLLVPFGTNALYKSTSGWKRFDKILEIGEEFESNGIRYKTGINNTVCVIQKSDMYSGNVVIPNQVNYNGTDYTVTSIGKSAFEGCVDLASVSIPGSVININAGAFYYCTGLKSVDIPDGVTTIGEGAFSKCGGLTSVTIPGSVISIDNNAFFQCYGLTQITSWIENPFTINNSVFPTSVYSNATLIVPSDTREAYRYVTGWKRFQNVVEIGEEFEADGLCYKIGGNYTVSVIQKSDIIFGDVVIPNQIRYNGINYTVTSIGETAFEGCIDIAYVSIPSSVTTICDGAFYSCTGLLSVDIPNGVTTIGEGAFSKCSNLTTVIIPGSVTSIGKNAFFQCYDLAQITSEIENLFTIDDGVFPTSVYSNATLFVPSGAKAAYQAVSAWKRFVNVVEIGQEFEVDGIRYKIGGNYKVSVVPKEMHYSGEIMIPDQVMYLGNKYTVTSIDISAFEGCNDLTFVSIPGSVTTIGTSAFEGCIGLSSVEIPNGVTAIGNGAFYGCTGLTSVDIPDGVTIIGNGAFSKCSNLTTVIIPGSVTSIDENAFFQCYGLTQITSWIENPFTINNSVFPTSVYSNATLFVPSGAEAAYQAVSAWKRFVNVVEIGQEFEADGIRYRIGGNYTVSVISKNEENSGIIVIPDQVNHNGTKYTVTSIAKSAFEGCVDITSVSIPSSVMTIGASAFEGCIGLSLVEIPNGVKTIDNGAFYYCTGLQNVDIPKGVTRIGEGAFSKCNGLTSVSIPSSVTSIDINAFSSCSNLTHIISEIQNPFIINKNVFATNIYSSATLFVPYGKKDAYQSKDAWKKIQNITEKIMGDVNLNGEVNNKDLDALEDYIMGRNPENFFKVMADLNSDGLVNVADIVELVKIITGNNSK